MGNYNNCCIKTMMCPQHKPCYIYVAQEFAGQGDPSSLVWASFSAPGWPCVFVPSWGLTGFGLLYAAPFLTVVLWTAWVLELLTMAAEAALLHGSLIFFLVQWDSLGKLFEE